MSDKMNREQLKKWLEQLHLESWHLELIVSGFALFLLLNAVDPLELISQKLRIERTSEPYSVTGVLLIFLNVVGRYGLLFMVLNLIMHLMLRGLWIGAVGLGSVSSTINYEQLNLSEYFETRLKKLVGSYDTYCINLDKICSVIFSLGFLTFFMMLSLAMGFVGLVFLLGIMTGMIGPGDIPSATEATAFAGALVIIYVLLSLVYIFDFVTLGALKRSKSISFLYYPIYRIFGWITLAFIYRPIYYNLLSNKFSRRAGWFLVPYVIIIVFLTSIYFEGNAYFYGKNSAWTAISECYDDERPEKMRVSKASIPSKVVEKGILPLFIRYKTSDDNEIAKVCKDFDEKTKPGVKSEVFGRRLGISTLDWDNKAEEALTCVSRIFEVRLNDSLHAEPDYHFAHHTNLGEKGIVAMIDTRNLPQGKNVILIRKLRDRFINKKDTLVYSDYAYIPFWLE